MLVSAGQDPHKDDPLGGMRLTTDGFAAMAGVVREIAYACCPGRIAASLEGGYNLQASAEAVVAVIRAFGGDVPAVTGTDINAASKIEEAKRIQGKYWKSLFSVRF